MNGRNDDLRRAETINRPHMRTDAALANAQKRMSIVSASFEFAHNAANGTTPQTRRSCITQRRGKLRAAVAAWPRVSQWPVWAVHVSSKALPKREYCDRFNGGSEPTPDLLILCCVRSQNKYLCNRSVRPAASQQKKRSFVLGVPRKRGQGLLPTHSSDKVAQGHKG